MHDLALMAIRKEAIKLIEGFEGKNISGKNYQKKLNSFLNRKLGKQTKALTKKSMTATLKNLNLNRN